MAQMKITHAQAQAFLAARGLSKSARSAEKRKLFAEIRRVHNLSRSQKLKVWVEDPGREDYCVIRDKRTGAPLDNGIPEKAPVMAVSPAVTATKTPAKKVTPVTAKAPAKTKVTPVTAKTPTKVPAVKKVKGVVSATKTATATIEVRATIGGKRQRLGWVSSEEMKAKVIAKAKADQLAATAA